MKIHLYKKLPIKWLLIVALILTVLSNWSYGNSYPIYVMITLLLAVLVYGEAFVHVTKKINLGEVLALMTVLVSLCAVFLGGLTVNAVKSCIMINISVLLPLAISSMEIDFEAGEKQICRAEWVGAAVVLLLPYMPGRWNSNSLGILIFQCATIGFLGFYLSTQKKYKLLALVYLAFCYAEVLSTGSRNSAMIMLLCLCLLLLPKKLLEVGWFYRLIYISAMLATVFAPNIMEFVFSNPQLMEKIEQFTSSFSDKAWGMDSHLNIILYVKNIFEDQDLLTRLLGQGVKSYHTHNLFYQSMFPYGIVGTACLYLFYAWIFELAYKLYKRNHDRLALACSVILVGHFLLQCAEVYMFGIESPFVLAFVPAGLILIRWNKWKHKNKTLPACQQLSENQYQAEKTMFESRPVR